MKTIRGFMDRMKSALGRARGRRGFDMMQMLFALAILSVVVALAAPSYFRSTEDAKITAAKSDVKSILGAIIMYKNDMGTLPSGTTSSDICTVLQKGGVTSEKTGQKVGPWMSTCPKKDPWGNDYKFDSTNMVVYTQVSDTVATQGGNTYITTSDLTALQSSATGTSTTGG